MSSREYDNVQFYRIEKTSRGYLLFKDSFEGFNIVGEHTLYAQAEAVRNRILEHGERIPQDRLSK